MCDFCINYRERCDAIRPALQQKLIDDTKLSQLKQIEEKNMIKLAEKDLESAWSEVSQNVYSQRVRIWYLLIFPDDV